MVNDKNKSQNFNLFIEYIGENNISFVWES
jgi:hypothetical protein